MQSQEPENKNEGGAFIKLSLQLFLSRALVTLAMLCCFLYFAQKMSTHAFGHYQSYWVQLYTLTAITGLGLSYVLYTYTPNFIAAWLQIITTKNWIVYLSFVLAGGIVFAWLRWQQQQEWIAINVMMLLFYTITTITETLLSICKRITVLVWLHLSFSCLFVLLHYWFISEAKSLQWLWNALTFLFAFRAIAGFYFARGALKNVLPDVHFHFQEVKKYWSFMGVYDVLHLLIRWVDKFIVSLLLSASVFAIYNNGTVEIPFLALALSVVSSALLIQIAHKNKDHHRAEVAALLKQSSKLLSSVSLPLFVFLFVFAEEFITFFFTEKYLASVPIFRMTLLIMPGRVLSYSSLLQSKKQGHLLLKGLLLDLLAVLVLVYPLYWLWNLSGIALSFVLGTYVSIAYYLWHMKKILQMPFASFLPFMYWLKILAASLIIMLLLKFFFNQWPFAYSFLAAAAFIGLFVLGLLRRLQKKIDK